MTYAHKHILTHKSAGERERGYCGERERECERERERIRKNRHSVKKDNKQ